MKLSDALNILEEISFYLELKGENVFKINAFNSAIRNLSQLNIGLSEGLKKGIIQNTKGVGKSILSILQEINEKGTTHVLTELQKEFPQTILELTKIHGLGPKKIKKLYESLNIASLGELEYACKENRLISIEGFGLKSQSKILESIQKVNSYRGYLLLHKAKAFAQQIENEILQKFSKLKILPTGELRRSCEIISKIEFVVVSDSKFLKHIKANENLISADDNRIELVRNDTRIVFHLAAEDEFYLRLFETTGPQKFTEKFKNQIKSRTKFSSEEEIFRSLSIPFIQPQLRDNTEIKNEGYKLVEMNDIKGLLHFHTNYSDGSNSIQEMLEYAEKLGLEYVLVCDHSKSAAYANGLSEDRVKAQWKEIDELNKKNLKVKILKGIECDILPDGSLDYSDDFLSKFDCVVASVHSRFNMNEEEMTNRICKALQNKYVKILGHPTGRLLLARDGYKLDIKKVIDTANKFNKVIELNADPNRLDLDWRWHQYAKKNGVKIAVCPDAHSTSGIENIRYGIEIAKKGGLEKEDIINTLDYKSFYNQHCKND